MAVAVTKCRVGLWAPGPHRPASRSHRLATSDAERRTQVLGTWATRRGVPALSHGAGWASRRGRTPRPQAPRLLRPGGEGEARAGGPPWPDLRDPSDEQGHLWEDRAPLLRDRRKAEARRPRATAGPGDVTVSTHRGFTRVPRCSAPGRKRRSTDAPTGFAAVPGEEAGPSGCATRLRDPLPARSLFPRGPRGVRRVCGTPLPARSLLPRGRSCCRLGRPCLSPGAGPSPARGPLPGAVRDMPFPRGHNWSFRDRHRATSGKALLAPSSASQSESSPSTMLSGTPAGHGVPTTPSPRPPRTFLSLAAPVPERMASIKACLASTRSLRGPELELDVVRDAGGAGGG